MKTLPRNVILQGDARTVLSGLLAQSIDCAITSPPYFQLRDYGVRGQLGLEATVEAWVENLRSAFAEVARVLKPHGSVWLNLGDSYSRAQRTGAPPKSLLAAPERLLLALMADGWIVRNKVVWAKANPMPHSVADRLNATYDFVYFLTRQPSYYFDLDAVREPHRSQRPASRRRESSPEERRARGPLAGGDNAGLRQLARRGEVGHRLGKNPGDVWHLPASGYRGAHFATFPPTLVERPLLATCPERICVQCDRAWRRPVRIRRSRAHGRGKPSDSARVRRYPTRYEVIREVGQLKPCGCFAPTRPGVVLDPFFGTGTVGEVARAHGRDWLGIELNSKYVRLAEARLGLRGRRGRLNGGRKGQSFLLAASAIHDPTKGGEKS